MSTRDIAYLRILRGPAKGGVFVLKDLSVYDIGRGDSCHVSVADKSISSSHARIYRRGEVWTFYDLNSETGSSVNDIPVTKRDLEQGDILRLGDVELQFGFQPPAKGGQEMPTSPPVVKTRSEAIRLTPTHPPPPATTEPTPGRGIMPPLPQPPEPAPVTAVAQVAATESGSAALRKHPLRRASDKPEEEPTDAFKFDLSDVLDGNSGTKVASRLKVLDGDSRDVGKEILLDVVGECIIGRSTNCALTLNDGKVSRLHCRIEPTRDGFMVTDLNSANGTVLNGEKVEQTILKPGDYLRVGLTVLGFELIPVEAM